MARLEARSVHLLYLMQLQRRLNVYLSCFPRPVSSNLRQPFVDNQVQNAVVSREQCREDHDDSLFWSRDHLIKCTWLIDREERPFTYSQSLSESSDAAVYL